MWLDILTSSEAEFTDRAIDSLRNVAWTRPLLKRLGKAGGLTSKNMPLMFEVRFAHELHRAGKFADYEHNAGVGDSTVEFRVTGKVTWLIELVSIRTSQAAKRAVTRRGLVSYRILRTDAEDKAQSEEAEMITAQQKIGEKVFAHGAPTKFPIPKSGQYHMIIADMRAYLDKGGDVFDYRQIAYGVQGIPRAYSWTIHYWPSFSGKREPIKGLFETSCPLQAAQFVQERIHFLGFVCERKYREGEISSVAYYLPNPHLLSDETAAKAYETFPLSQGKSE